MSVPQRQACGSVWSWMPRQPAHEADASAVDGKAHPTRSTPQTYPGSFFATGLSTMCKENGRGARAIYVIHHRQAQYSPTAMTAGAETILAGAGQGPLRGNRTNQTRYARRISGIKSAQQSRAENSSILLSPKPKSTARESRERQVRPTHRYKPYPRAEVSCVISRLIDAMRREMSHEEKIWARRRPPSEHLRQQDTGKVAVPLASRKPTKIVAAQKKFLLARECHSARII